MNEIKKQIRYKLLLQSR